MLEWIARGLGQGRVTTRYPRGARPRDTRALPPELAGLPPGEDAYLAATRRPLSARTRALRRSLHVRHIDCGSDGSEEWEIQALWNPYYDIQRLGFFLTASPRHADVLLVTGPVTAAMRGPLERTWEVMPEPKALVAVGDDACSGGLCAGDRSLGDVEHATDGADRSDGAAGGLTAGGVDAVLGVDVYVPGSPPAPLAIMRGLLLAAGLPAPRSAAVATTPTTEGRAA